jgi:RHS repeat-associated protein
MTRSRVVRLAVLGLGLLAFVRSAGASESDWARLDALLHGIEAGTLPEPMAGAARAHGSGRPDAALAGFVADVEASVARRRADFDRAARLDLPPKARERLAAARAAHDRGQRRLLALLRSIAAARSSESVSGAAREAREILSRLAAASRRFPLSDELARPRLHRPSLQAPALRTRRGNTLAPGAAMLAAEAPPAAAEGLPGQEAIPAAIRATAAGLAGPVDVYSWVRDQIRPEFYYGAMKGPLQTLLESSGNDADTAALLVALFRAKGIPARFARGTVEIGTARLQAVTGTTTAELALEVLARAGIPHEPVLGAGGVTAVRMERVWAEAYVPYANYRGTPVDAQGKIWLPLDASWKELVPPGGLDVVSVLGFNVNAAMDEYLDGDSSRTPLEYLRQGVTNGLAAQGKTYDEALNHRDPRPEGLGILPNTLPFAVTGDAERAYQLPDTLVHTVHLRATREATPLLDVTLPVPDVVGQRLTLAYVPFDDDDASTAARYGGVTRTPPYLLDLRLVVKRGGVEVAAGDAPVGAGVVFDLAMDVTHPGGTETIENRLIAGNLTAIGLGGREVTGSESGTSRAAQILSRVAWSYLDRWNRSDAELADIFRVVPVRPTVSACMVMSAIDVEYADGDPLYPVSFDWKGVAIDADLRATSPVGVFDRAAETRFLLFSGLEGSILENRALESGLGVESVSTAKTLQLARQQGLPILDLERDEAETVVPGLGLDPLVEEEVLAATRRGLSVRLPAAPVHDLAWSGVGYRILDPETGEAAYQLQGGFSGGVTAPSTFDWPTGLRDTLVDQGEDPAPSGTPVARLTRLVSSDFQEGIVNEVLERPLRVLAMTAEGLRAAGAKVTFQVVGGGGTLVDPLSGEPAGDTITVYADSRGEAATRLRLGRKTNEIPRFMCLEDVPCSTEDEVYATQVGLNLVTASAAGAVLDEPFTALGKPDTRCPADFLAQHPDATECVYYRFGIVDGTGGANTLRVAGTVNVLTTDQHANPVANVRIHYGYDPPPVLGTPPAGWVPSRPATTTEAHLLKLKDYRRCSETNALVQWGGCPGEATEVVVPTAVNGAFVYPVLGDSLYSVYSFHAGPASEPNLLRFYFGTFGQLCSPSCPLTETRPMVRAEATARPTLVNRFGDLIEAYPPGGAARLEFSAQVLSEGYVLQRSTDSKGKVHYRAIGNNTWSREALEDAEFTIKPTTDGTTSSSGANPVGAGKYEASMGIGSTPGLNTVEWQAKLVPLQIPYLPDRPESTDEVDPSAVDDATLTIAKRKFPERPQILGSTFTLWGVKATVDSAQPSTLRIDNGLTRGKTQVAHTIAPDAYRALLEPVGARFDLLRGKQQILSSTGTSVDPFEVPAGLPLAIGDYTAQLSVLGVAGGKDIVSTPLPLTASLLLELTTPNVILPLSATPATGTACVTQDRIVFRLGEKSRVTVIVSEDHVLEGVLDGVPQSVNDTLLEAGMHTIVVPRALLVALGKSDVPFKLSAVSDQQPLVQATATGAIRLSQDLLTLQPERIQIHLVVDPTNQSVCTVSFFHPDGTREEPSIVFHLCDAAHVTLRLDGKVLTSSVDGGPPLLLQDLPLAGGAHKVTIPTAEFGLRPGTTVPFEVSAVRDSDPAQQATRPGVIETSVTNRSVLPVGHTFVKGVDIFDGHVVAQETDLSLPGRHLGLEVTRTYSSAGKSPEGPLGAGWHWAYDARLSPATDCGLISLQTADGSSQVFRALGPATFVPQKGYHGRLLKSGPDFDYFDKAGNRHHFVPLATAGDPGGFALAYTEEPHGDRLLVSHDSAGRVTEIAEVQGGVPVRKLVPAWEAKFGSDRLKSIEAVRSDGMPLRLRVEYDYDDFGNLVKVTRFGTNPEGPVAADRVQRYEYTTADGRDTHQLREVTGANGERRRYEYFTHDDRFPGEGPDGFLVVWEKEEFVRRVVEFPQAQETTEFSYDYQGALASQRWKTTVTDPRGFSSLYVLNGNGSPLEITEAVGKPEERQTTIRWKAADIVKEDETDANGRLTRYEHDDRGNLTKETIVTTDLGEVVTHYAYDSRFNKLTQKVDAENRTTSYTIDPSTGDLTAMVDAVGNRTGYAYTPAGLLREVTDPRGHLTTHSDHDDYGNARRIVDAAGNATRRQFDARGRLRLEEDDFGRRREIEYDGLDRPTLQRRVAASGSDDEVTRRAYYPGGQVQTETNANGAQTAFRLDGLNRVVATETKVGAETLTTLLSYDGNGNKIREKDRREVWRNFDYDGLNRVVRVKISAGPDTGPVGQVATFGYDAVGNKKSETDVAGLETRFDYDGLYRVSRKRLPEANPSTGDPYAESYANDRVGNRRSVTDANGHATSFEYDGLNRLTKTTNALGQVATIAYDDPDGSHVNKSEEHDLTRGSRITYLYDVLNREREHKVRLEGAGSAGEVYTTTTAYDDAQHAMTVTDPRGTSIRRRMDGLDHLVEEIVDDRAGGLKLRTTVAYDGLGNRKSVTDPNGHTTRFGRDGLGRLTATTDAQEHTTRYTYDGEGLKTSETDRRGVVRNFTYDNLARARKTTLVPSISSVPWSHEVQYQDLARKRIEIDARGFQTTYDLDGLGRVLKLTDATSLKKTIVTRWDGVNKREETDKRGHTTRYEYDEINRWTKVTDPAPFELQTVETLYEDGANRVTETDRRGIKKVTQKDPLGRVLSVTRAVGAPEEAVLERNTYDGNSNRLTTKDAEGKETRFGYDAANRLQSRTDGFGTPEVATTTYVNDKNGNPIEERDQRAADLSEPWSVRRTYDELNRLETVTDGEGHTTSYGYDPEGNRTSVKQPLGQVTSYDYDELGKLTKVTQPMVALAAGGTIAPVTSYVYDPNRNRVKQTDANSHVVEMAYDELNRMTSMTQDPSGFGYVTVHEYDENGNETKLTDPKGQTVSSTYDELNRLKTKAYGFAAGDSVRPWRHTTGVVYGYDPNNNLKQVDESVATRTNAETLVTYRSFDNLDRLISETTMLPDQPSTGERTRTVAYTYFKNGTRQTVTDPAGAVTSYTYDGQNRLKTATTAGGQTGYSYYPDDLLKDVTYPNGVVATHGYDKADRLKSLANQRVLDPAHPTVRRTVSSYAYTYDDNGNRRTQMETNGGAIETTTYSYDSLDRLETITYPVDARFPNGRVLDYGYDAVGNRTGETEKDAAGVVLATKKGFFDNLNRLMRLEEPAQTTTFAWDANGNQIGKTEHGVTTAYRYDVRDKLVEVDQGASILGRYEYCYDGKRVKKIGEDGIRQYIYDQTSTLLEYDDAGNQVAKYDYGSDRLITLTRGTDRRFYSLDGLRSVVNLTDPAGTTKASYHLDAWGQFRFPDELNAGNDPAASKNRFAFTGYQWDPETGLYNAKARYFDPNLGRFLSQDSYLGQIDSPPSLHRYFYARENPTRYIDPTGHADFRITGYLPIDPDTGEYIPTASEDVTVYSSPTNEQIAAMAQRGEISKGEAVIGQVGNDARVLARTPDWQKSSGRLYVEGAATSLAQDFSAPMLHMMHGAYTNNGGEFALGAAEDVGGAALGVLLSEAGGMAGEALANKFPALRRNVWGEPALNPQTPLGLPRTSGAPKASIKAESPTGDNAAPSPDAQAPSASEPNLQDATGSPAKRTRAPSVRNRDYPNRPWKSTRDRLEAGAKDAEGNIRCQDPSCQVPEGRVQQPGEGTAQHNPPLVETHNTIGYDTDQPTRTRLYNETADALHCIQCQRAEGGRTQQTYRQDTGPNYKPKPTRATRKAPPVTSTPKVKENE